MASEDPLEVRRGEAGSYTYLGLSHNILAGAEHTGNRFSVVEMTLQPGAGVPRHDHPEVVFAWYVLAGTVTVVTDDGSLELSPRDFLLDPPGFKHALANRGDQAARLLVVFAPAGCERFFVAAADAITSEVPQISLPSETLQTLAELAGHHGWELDHDAETG